MTYNHKLFILYNRENSFTLSLRSEIDKTIVLVSDQTVDKKATRENVLKAADVLLARLNDKAKGDRLMTIKFHYEEPQDSKDLTLDDVECNQFFVNRNGELCQKVTARTYNRITNTHGLPEGEALDYQYNNPTDIEIQRVLPRVEKIEY